MELDSYTDNQTPSSERWMCCIKRLFVLFDQSFEVWWWPKFINFYCSVFMLHCIKCVKNAQLSFHLPLSKGHLQSIIFIFQLRFGISNQFMTDPRWFFWFILKCKNVWDHLNQLSWTRMLCHYLQVYLATMNNLSYLARESFVFNFTGSKIQLHVYIRTYFIWCT